jgi:Pilus formation protein N terminal region
MIKSKFLSVFLCASALMTVSAHAATQTIMVAVDESQIMQLPTQPGAVVIGNPSIADVSIQGQQLFVHGRSFGQTNLTILDLQGNQIANFKLIGTLEQDSLVTVYRGPQRFSYSCTGTCQGNIQTGDNSEFFRNLNEQTRSKSDLASGSSTAEAKAPEAPQ